MCWLLNGVGAVMVTVGSVFVIRFFAGRGEHSPVMAAPRETETMIVGVILLALGFLLLALGLTGTVCTNLGLA